MTPGGHLPAELRHRQGHSNTVLAPVAEDSSEDVAANPNMSGRSATPLGCGSATDMQAPACGIRRARDAVASPEVRTSPFPSADRDLTTWTRRSLRSLRRTGVVWLQNTTARASMLTQASSLTMARLWYVRISFVVVVRLEITSLVCAGIPLAC